MSTQPREQAIHIHRRAAVVILTQLQADITTQRQDQATLIQHLMGLHHMARLLEQATHIQHQVILIQRLVATSRLLMVAHLMGLHHMARQVNRMVPHPTVLLPTELPSTAHLRHMVHLNTQHRLTPRPQGHKG